MPKRPLENEESVAGPSKVAKIESQGSTDQKENEEENTKTTGSDDQLRQEINKNFSRNDPLSRTFNEGATVAEIYEAFTDAIVYDPVMLDVYQQPDMKEIIERVRPDFPYPVIHDLVLKRFQQTEERLKSVLNSLINTFFSIYLSMVLFRKTTFALVEVAYFEDNGNRKTIVIGCIPYLLSHKLHENILELIFKYKIEHRCYHIVGSTVEFDDIIEKTISGLPSRNNQKLPEYLSIYKKFSELDIEELNRSILKCLEMAKEIELKFFEILNSDHQLATIMDQLEVIQTDQTRLETRIRNIRREPELISCYRSSRTQLDFLCVYELRNLRKSINELIAHLKNYNESKYEEPMIPSDEAIPDNSAVLVHYNLNGTNGFIHCRKVLESCANVLNNDFTDLRQWASHRWKDNPITRVVSNFNTFVERVTSRIEEDEHLWIQVFLIKQWLPVVPHSVTPSPSLASLSIQE